MLLLPGCLHWNVADLMTALRRSVCLLHLSLCLRCPSLQSLQAGSPHAEPSLWLPAYPHLLLVGVEYDLQFKHRNELPQSTKMLS